MSGSEAEGRASQWGSLSAGTIQGTASSPSFSCNPVAHLSCMYVGRGSSATVMSIPDHGTSLSAAGLLLEMAFRASLHVADDVIPCFHYLLPQPCALPSMP